MTFQLTLTASDWTEVAAESAYTEAGLQVDDGKVAVYITDAGAPTINQSGFMVLEPTRSSELVVALPSGQVIYARALGNRGATIRGYRSPV